LDPHIHEDAIFGVKPDLIGDFRSQADPGGCVVWSVGFDVVMVRARPPRPRS
jgi:hypothetical protein